MFDKINLVPPWTGDGFGRWDHTGWDWSWLLGWHGTMLLLFILLTAAVLVLSLRLATRYDVPTRAAPSRSHRTTSLAAKP